MFTASNHVDITSLPKETTTIRGRTPLKIYNLKNSCVASYKKCVIWQLWCVSKSISILTHAVRHLIEKYQRIKVFDKNASKMAHQFNSYSCGMTYFLSKMTLILRSMWYSRVKQAYSKGLQKPEYLI